MEKQNLGNIIKEARLKINMSESEFAKIMNVSSQRVINWEANIEVPNNETRTKLADILKIDVALLRQDEIKSSDVLRWLFIISGSMLFIFSIMRYFMAVTYDMMYMLFSNDTSRYDENINGSKLCLILALACFAIAILIDLKAKKKLK